MAGIMTHSFFKLALLSTLALAATASLTACQTPDPNNPFAPKVVMGVEDYTYDATDSLISGARGLSANTPILVGTLSDVDKLERSSTFGRVISEQVSARLSQRGFSVSELKMRNSVNIKEGLGDPNESGEFLFSRDISAIGGAHQAAVAVTGTYAVAGKEILVNLKMIDVSTGKLLSASDFNVPLDSNTRPLVKNDVTSFYGTSMAY